MSSKNSVSLKWRRIACEDNSRGLKISVVNIYQIVVRAYENRSVKKNSAINKLLFYYQVVNIGT